MPRRLFRRSPEGRRTDSKTFARRGRGARPRPARYVLLPPGLILLAHAVFSVLPQRAQADLLYWNALVPARYSAPPWSPVAYGSGLEAAWPFAGSALLHSDWGHAFSNAVGLLLFGAVIVRSAGGGRAGAIAYGVLLAAGLVGGGLAHLWSEWPGGAAAIGASGAVFSLLAASLIALATPRGRGAGASAARRQPGPGLLQLAVAGALVLFLAGLGQQGIAWEAHLGAAAAGAAAWFVLSAALGRWHRS